MSCTKRAADAADRAAAIVASAAAHPPKRARPLPKAPTFVFAKPLASVANVLAAAFPSSRVVAFEDFKTYTASMPNNILKLKASSVPPGN